MAEEIYRQLSKAYGSPESKYLPKIFEMCLTKEEVSVLLSLPATPEEVAVKLTVEAAKVAENLRELFNKGFVLYKQVDGKLRYGLNSSLWESILPDTRDFEKFGEELLDLWEHYHDEEVVPNYDALYVRVIPVEKVIPMKWGEILPYEQISGIFENTKTIAVTECSCRTLTRQCDNPTDVCLVFNEFADIIIERGIAKRISKEEAFSIVKRCEDLGLVHQLNNSEPEGYEFLCNCCSCCCTFLKGMIVLGKKGIAAKSRYVSSVDSNLCDEGCSICASRCNFGAMNIVDSKAVVDKEKCFGCGLCASKCPTNAIELIPVRSPEHIVDHLEKAPSNLVDTLIIE
ncbi:MAG: 4Fe-4S binding protein [Candidatus Bathyarchaeota archaeon]|nr:MAG: 4Fe-4S binding protein [Candidatus Bathyarchaeota archaeon]